MTASFSIIVPLAEKETAWRDLLPLLPLSPLPEVNIILAAHQPPPTDWQESAAARWLQCPRQGRAAQMNAAAAQATGEWLWFVHADSRPSAEAFSCLRQTVARDGNAIYYFALRFHNGGWKMRINEWGVYWRCLLFKNPFGDQAFCVAKKTFTALGGYPEDAEYGEDHLFILKARRQGVLVRRLPAVVNTSARRYQRQGWWATVRLFQKLWFKQWRQHRKSA